MVHLFEDLVHFLGPDKRFGILIVEANEFLDDRDQLRHAFENTAPDSFACNLPKPALYQIQP